MRAVVQRVNHAKVIVKNNTISSIEKGLLVLLAIEDDDNQDDLKWMAGKIAKMRLFSDSNDVMNLSVNDINGNILVVSQFTLFASTKKGNRPSYTSAANPLYAKKMYLEFINILNNNFDIKTAQGEFGAMMNIEMCNDGPVTIIIDSKNKY